MAIPHFTKHSAGERLPRHLHVAPYAAVLISGSYVEAGDGGRLAVEPGHVVIHRPYESHADHFGGRGALVLNLSVEWDGGPVATIPDPERIAQLARRDPRLAAEALRREMVAVSTGRSGDWPDLLAHDLRRSACLDLARWADRHGLSPQSLSRGFRAVFGVTPKRFRSDQRVLQAIRLIPMWRGSGAELAAALGFCDQAHMCRSVARLSGRSVSDFRVK